MTKRFTIALEGKAAEILSRIPRSVRGLVLKRVIEEADRMGYFRCILLDEAEEELTLRKRKRGRKRKDVCDVSGEKIAERIIRDGNEPGTEAGDIEERELGSGSRVKEEVSTEEGPKWVKEIREKIRKRVEI